MLIVVKRINSTLVNLESKRVASFWGSADMYGIQKRVGEIFYASLTDVYNGFWQQGSLKNGQIIPVEVYEIALLSYGVKDKFMQILEPIHLTSKLIKYPLVWLTEGKMLIF